MSGIVCITGLFLLTPLTHLKRYWINSSTIKIRPAELCDFFLKIMRPQILNYATKNRKLCEIMRFLFRVHIDAKTCEIVVFYVTGTFTNAQTTHTR